MPGAVLLNWFTAKLGVRPAQASLPLKYAIPARASDIGLGVFAPMLRCGALCLSVWLGVLGAADAQVPGKPRGQVAPGESVQEQARKVGQADARLIEVYRLIGQGQSRGALERARELVQKFPDFQLAQLVYGDLLSAQARPLRGFGDVPEPIAAAANGNLADLREESLLRLRALRERPPAGHLPSQFLRLSARNRHAIAVDASKSRLYLFANGPQGMQLVADYYISVGRQGIQKALEGDLRTPVGMYFITSNLDPRALQEFYGVGALPINYPNPLDVRLGRTGSGIWLHGTPPTQFARAPRATDGCVVLANPDLAHIISTVETRTTPVLIAKTINWVPTERRQAESVHFENTLMAWNEARQRGDVDAAMAFYTADFNASGRDLAEQRKAMESSVRRLRGRSAELKDLSILRWTDGQADSMVVTFGDVAQGQTTGPVVRQYWLRQGGNWRIFFERVLA